GADARDGGRVDEADVAEPTDAAAGAAASVLLRRLRRRLRARRRYLGPGGVGREQRPAPRQAIGAVTIGEQPEVADPDEAGGQDVKEEPAQKLHAVERHDLRTAGVVAVAEGDPGVLDVDDARVADRDTMGVTGEVLEHLLGGSERAFGVDDPFSGALLREERGETGGRRERGR